MDRPLTQADADEIMAYLNRVDPKHRRIRIDNSDGGWAIVFLEGNVLRAYLHPRTFLDIIRDEGPGETVLKVV